MDNSQLQRLRDQLWRKKPAQAELDQSTLAPAQLQDELRLTRLLNRLPNAPVSSNFTARVLQAAAKTEPAPAVAWWQAFTLRRWIPRLAVGLFTLVFGGLSIQQYQAVQHTHIAQSVSHVAVANQDAQLADMLNNFETIERMSRIQPVDEELLLTLR